MLESALLAVLDLAHRGLEGAMTGTMQRRF
jgi:hypothetical protein